MTKKIDIEERVARAQQLRAAIGEPAGLVGEARRLLAATPAACTHLVAFSSEGFAVAAVTTALALEGGRELGVERASHLAPLDPGPEREQWRWMSVEQALGLGQARPWVRQWAAQRGGGEPLAPSVRWHLAKVA
jgi:hypothetical protein